MRLRPVALILRISLGSICYSQSPCAKHAEFDPATNSVRLVDCHDAVISSQSVNDRVGTKTAGPPLTLQIPTIDASVAKSNNEYAVWQNDYTKRIFEHQNMYTVVIFIIVNMLVVSGLYFAWIQFSATLHLTRRLRATSPLASDSSKGKDIEPAQWTTQQLKVGPDGVAISSSFIGLIILGISMGFYLMYLKYVYPIRTATTESTSTGTYTPDSLQAPKGH